MGFKNTLTNMTGRLKQRLKSRRGALVAFLILLLLLAGIMVSDRWVVNDLTDPLHRQDLNAVPTELDRKPPGVVFTSTMINLLNTEFNRPFGGYRPDNLFWFGGVMPFDNVENFQKGVVEVTQRTVIYLKERVSRAGGGSDEFDELLVKASESLNYKKEQVLLTKWQFRDGLSYLRQYRTALMDGRSDFVVRTDSLYDLLRVYRELLGDTHRNLAKWEEKSGKPVSTFDTDDYYYKALGEASATLALLRAARIEFEDIFRAKGCLVYFEELEKSLVYATKTNPPWVVLDGSVSAQFWPNHRSNLETHINDARFKIVSMMDNINR